MKQIDFENLNEKNDYLISDFIERGVNMEFIKKGQNYLIKDSGGRIVSEKEKLQLEKNELILEDLKSTSGCQGKTTKKITSLNKKIKHLDDTKQKTSKTV